jgi:excisionase family DNA binding protein
MSNVGERLLLTPAEVAVRLGLSRSKVYRMIERGELPSLRIGRAVRVPCRAFEEWLRCVERESADWTPRVVDGGLR